MDDLSECDSDEAVNFLTLPPSDSYLTLPDDVKNVLRNFGIDNELHEDSPQIPGMTTGDLCTMICNRFSEIDQLDDQFPSSTPEQSTTLYNHHLLCNHQF
ncbi:hypothetical protein EVAR_51483_1 [Eumeta japonica]|uniref:Uncharacterized protein n=1 Tax=Eumeta variegata TaxID=151549 RepID=A0A4C1XCV3_EUMVA|nr:hypothetical protein EVAR_51483_1 [Eumeta japonica]